MMLFPDMLTEAAKQANIKVPDDPNGTVKKWKPEEFPHFHVFCLTQLCRPIQWGEHWDNAKVIASIPEADLKTITLEQLMAKGLHFQS